MVSIAAQGYLLCIHQLVAHSGISVEDAVASLFRKIAEQIPLDRVVFISLTLCKALMHDFDRINRAYSQHFSVNPPARACLSVDLPSDELLRMDVVGVRPDASPDARAQLDHIVHRSRHLHVQSRSYWAPANIGPYSQSVMVRECSIVHSIESNLTEISE